jgi:hypothetical protein
LDLSVPAVLTALAEQRPIFHSEADFQHAIAWPDHQDGFSQSEQTFPEYNALIGECRTSADAMGRLS